MAEINIPVNDLLIDQESDQRFENTPSVKMSLSRCVSDINLPEREMNINGNDLGKKTFNTVIFDRFFSSTCQYNYKSIVGNDRLPNDLELNSLEVPSPGKLTEDSKDSGWVEEQFYNDPSIRDNDRKEAILSPKRKRSDPQIVCSVSGSLDSILGDLHSIPIQILSTSEDEAVGPNGLTMKSFKENYFCGKSPKDLNQMIVELSGHRKSEEIFLWVLREKTNPDVFHVHIIGREAGCLLGQIPLNETEFKRAQTEGLFDKFLSLLLLDSVQ